MENLKYDGLPMLLRSEQCAELLGMSAGNWRLMVRQGRAPRSIRLGRRAVRWRTADVQRWITASCPHVENETEGVKA